jgi:TRAP-type C4-dicarboxylate transport system permease small subunit
MAGNRAMPGKVLVAVENALAGLSCVTLFAIMVLVTVDAAGRAFFGLPLQIQFELTQNYLLVMVITLALPWGYREGGKVTVDFLVDRLPVRVAAGVNAVNLLLALAVFVVITGTSMGGVIEAFRNDETVLGIIDWPVAYARVWVPVGTGVLCLRLANDVFVQISRLAGRSAGPAAASGSSNAELS